MTRLGESGLEAEPARVGERASGIARVRGPGVMFGARAPSMRDNARYQDWAARMERTTARSTGSAGRCAHGQRAAVSARC